jgi:BMFP domain-containing protein YqiC
MSANPGHNFSPISTDGVANVDISNVSNIQDTLQYLLNTVNTLQQEVSTHASVIAELSALRNENASLKSKIATLEAQLASSSSPSATSAVSASVSSAKPTSLAAQNVSPAVQATYSAVAARPAIRSPTKKRKLAASRAFQPIDPEAPRGFQYLYLNRNRKLTRSEIRRNLRLLGLDLSRVLDVCFPGPKAISLLVHVQYLQESASVIC